MPSVFRVRTIFTGVAGTPWYTNMHFQPPPEYGISPLTTLVRNFWSGISGTLGTPVKCQVESDIVEMDEGTGEIIGSTSAPVAVLNFDQPGPLGPNASQGLLRINTGQYANGRKVIGHVFIPAVRSAGYGADGNFTAGLPTLWATEGDKLRTTSQGGNLPGFGVYSRPRLSILPLPVKPGKFYGATSVTSTNKPAVLRSRRD